MTTSDDDVTIWTQRTGDLSWREIDKEVILLDLRSATYLRLNETGALLWAMLEPGTTVARLTHSLADHYGIAVAQAEGDVNGFLESCASMGLVERRRPNRAPR